MPTYLSPGVYSRVVEIAQLPNAQGPLRPGFIGTAQKGPVNTPVLITNAQQFIDVFGEPFPDSYLGYAVLAYLEEGNQAYVLRIGVECEAGQPAALDSICIDTSGSRVEGWGRVPVFSGIDVGRLTLRGIGNGTNNNPSPVSFHPASIFNINYTDASLSSTNGATAATLGVTGAYTGDIDDSFTLVINSEPDLSAGAGIGGCEFQIIRNSDGEVLVDDVLVDPSANNVSNYIQVPDAGFSVRVELTAGELDVGDTFTWNVEPDNRSFAVAVEGATTPNVYQMPTATYTDVTSFITAANALLVSEDYIFASTIVDGVEIAEIITVTEGERIQLMATNAFALEVNTQQYAWDIPRAFLLGLDPGPHSFSSQNNRVLLNVIGENDTQQIGVSVATGNNITTASIVGTIDSAGTTGGEVYYEAIELTVPGGTTHLAIITSEDHQYDTLELEANFSNIKVLRFADEVDILNPYRRSYRGFFDSRLSLPAPGQNNPANPLSCELNSLSAQCVSDSNYFQNIVGWFVAPSAGTWADDITIQLSLFTEGVGDIAGRYKLVVLGREGEILERVEDFTFDKNDDNYIANLINPGSSGGGLRGNLYVHWEERPGFLNNDPNLSTYEIRQPSQFASRQYTGGANGIPTDPSFSNLLDAAIIGSPQLATGLYAFENPEGVEIDVLATPGFSSGAVIGTAIQIVSGRGDSVYLVDPPFGLRPQQTVDWHNGMLLSDLQQAINTSYAGLYTGWLLVFDQFSGQNVWIPPSGHVAGVFSRSAREGEPWSAPAGLRRGRLLSPIAVEYSPTQGERDLLYGSGNSVNPIVNFTQEGLTIWGNRTLQRGESPLSRMDVRLLVNRVRRGLAQLLRNFVFEPNDRVLWSQVRASINPFLSDIQSRRGLVEFVVIVDENNNTPERIDRGELWVSVILVPQRAAEIVVLNIGVTRQSVSLTSEEVLSAVGVVNGG